ncbi:MAG TPA: PAS domain-containing protein [Microbacterium sp.]|nr:PAS domain-containing protein [Microbacterium sp.]
MTVLTESDVRYEDFAEVRRATAPLMQAIAAVGGTDCEVVLHDLSSHDLDHSIAAIVNGHVSGREVGGPSTNLGIEVLQNEAADHNAYGYRGRTSDGRELISSSVYYRDRDGHIIAALCINRDLSRVQTVMAALGGLLPEAQSDVTDGPRELIGPDVSSVLDDMISEAIAAVGMPTTAMGKEDRIEVLRLLEGRGAFHIKRAADKVASRLGVSRVTVYGYLDEVRNG